MQSRNEPMVNIRKSRLLSSCSASRPSASRTLNGWPAALGGVCGSVNEKMPRTIEPPAASRIGTASASACSTLPTMIPATIQPNVPSTRMSGNSLAGSLIWWNEIELVSESVGM